ncbi:hypothetical protein M514_10342 [Trichuris suis]|uniref:Uncharacterized protein n=1 Tax=Trichuris suis TaxID=68888 RepID=A0A085NIP2_9BILA|nr:hypothetical protein M514_10342 [Trichuris suis]
MEHSAVTTARAIDLYRKGVSQLPQLSCDSQSKMQRLVATISNGKLRLNGKLADTLKKYSQPRFPENSKQQQQQPPRQDEMYKEENGTDEGKDTTLAEVAEPKLATATGAPVGETDEAERLDQLTDNPIKTACCDCLPSNYAAFAIAIVEVALILAWFILHSFYPVMVTKQTSKLDATAISARAIVTILLLSTVVLLFVGIFMKRPWLFWPHMIVQMAFVCAGMAMTFVTVLVMSIGSEASEYVFAKLFSPESIPWFEVTLGPIWPFCLAVIFNFTAAIAIWFYTVVKHCYHEINSKNKQSQSADTSTCSKCYLKILRKVKGDKAPSNCMEKNRNNSAEGNQLEGLGRQLYLVKL